MLTLTLALTLTLSPNPTPRCYDTFQNVPRLTDKMLGECGSRRIAQRCELPLTLTLPNSFNPTPNPHPSPLTLNP